jgi:signal transduction histidine kinase
MLGYSEAELLSLSVMEIHRPDDLPDVLEHIAALAEGRGVMAENIPVLRKDGGVFFADISTNTIMYHGQPCLIGFFRDITERKEAEEALQRERKTLQHLLEASDRELKLIAYDIHDGLAQLLTGATMHMQSYNRLKDDDPEKAAKICDNAQKLLEDSLAEARRLIRRVRLPLLDEYGVVVAVQSLVQESRASETEIEFHSQVEFERLEAVLENAIYRIVQEGLANALRHSESERIRVALIQEGDVVRVEVRDWGIGFDQETVKEKAYGLKGIRERVRLLDGKVAIDSVPGEGTHLVVRLPLGWKT